MFYCFILWKISFLVSSTDDKGPLKIVQTQSVLFLKSMSEKDGSEIERLSIWITLSSLKTRKWWLF